MVERYEKIYEFCIPLCHHEVETTSGEMFGMGESPSIEAKVFVSKDNYSESNLLLDGGQHDSCRMDDFT